MILIVRYLVVVRLASKSCYCNLMSNPFVIYGSKFINLLTNLALPLMYKVLINLPAYTLAHKFQSAIYD